MSKSDTAIILARAKNLLKSGEEVMKKLKDRGGQEITTKALKGVTGFNKGEMAPLLVQFYEVTKNAMEVISSLQALELRSQAKCDELEKKIEAKSSDPLNSVNIRSVIKDELLKAVPTITQSVIAETDKKWSDLFKNQIKLVDTKNQQEKPSNGSYSARIEGKKLAREIIAEEDRQRNVIIRGYTLEGLAANDDDNVGSENRSYSNAPIAVDYLITNGLKEPSLTDSVQKVTFVGKPYFSPSSEYDDKVPNEDGEDHRKQTFKVRDITSVLSEPPRGISWADR